LVDGITSAIGAVKDIITGEKSITSTIVDGLKSLLPKAKTEGGHVSENVADGIEEKVGNVTTATSGVADKIGIELDKAPPAAKITGHKTSIEMAAGIASGISAVSAAAKSVVDAAKIEMDRLWTLQQSSKERARRSDSGSGGSSKVKESGPHASEWVTSVSGSGSSWNANWNDNGKVEYFGASNTLYSLIAGMYVSESVWNSLNDAQKKGLIKHGRGPVSSTGAILPITETGDIIKEPELVLTNGPDIPPEDMQFKKGGEVPETGIALVHEGEWVIPTKGGPVMTGGKDITLNMTYNISGAGDDLNNILEKHDRDLLRKLKMLV